ncbi:MAG TPA: hypothetical protein VN361_07425, partial [Oxalicibacterium sp.]|nr:hypothetical protein [Oxalicibacterium sp.]
PRRSRRAADRPAQKSATKVIALFPQKTVLDIARIAAPGNVAVTFCNGTAHCVVEMMCLVKLFQGYWFRRADSLFHILDW